MQAISLNLKKYSIKSITYFQKQLVIPLLRVKSRIYIQKIFEVFPIQHPMSTNTI